jgi:hypothetical protein
VAYTLPSKQKKRKAPAWALAGFSKMQCRDIESLVPNTVPCTTANVPEPVTTVVSTTPTPAQSGKAGGKGKGKKRSIEEAKPNALTAWMASKKPAVETVQQSVTSTQPSEPLVPETPSQGTGTDSQSVSKERIMTGVVCERCADRADEVVAKIHENHDRVKTVTESIWNHCETVCTSGKAESDDCSNTDCDRFYKRLTSMNDLNRCLELVGRAKVPIVYENDP